MADILRELLEPPPEGRYCPFPALVLTGQPYRLKRALDVVGASLALAISSGLWLLAAAVIKLSDGGPVFFVQQRVGRDGRPFRLLKLRTMIPQAEELKAGLLSRSDVAGAFKMTDDPRVTPVGRVLRLLKIDELPQLLNVLKGEMSLVGPRPTSTEEVLRAYDAQACQKFLASAKPGLTGWTQLRETLHGKMDLPRQIECDLVYLRRQSLLLDCAILLLTVPAILWRHRSS